MTEVARPSLLAAVVAALSLLFAGIAQASYPTGNLLQNAGAEDGSATADGNSVFTPPQWFTLDDSRVTAVLYGAPGFLTAQQGAAYGGGHSFFAGGPPEPGSTMSDSHVFQGVDFPNDVVAEFAGGRVQATLGGCLGGYADQDDFAQLEVTFLSPAPTVTVLMGPKANERGARTELLPRSVTGIVPEGTTQAQVRLEFVRLSGVNTSYDGYADNVSLILSPAGSLPAAPNCTTSTPGGGTGPTGPGAPAGGGPTTTPFVVARGSSNATLRSGRIGVVLACTAVNAPCSGGLRLSVPSLSAGASSVTLGSTAFTIPAGRITTVKVSLRRRAKVRVKRMSARRLGRLKVTANVTMGAASTKFSLRLRR
jgi:hypothetical protein